MASLLHRVSCVLSIAIASSLGCKGSGADAGVDEGAPSTDTAAGFTEAYARASCSLAASCCAGGAVVKSECLAALRTQAGQFAQYGGAYDQARGAVCVQSLQALSGSCPSEEALRALADQCASAYRGETPPGKPCARDADCAPDDAGAAACAPAADGGLVCVVGAAGALGDACGAPSGAAPGDAGPRYDRCGAGLFCRASGTCAQRFGVGASCDPAAPLSCEDGFYCPNDSLLCAPKKANGAVCASDAECVSEQCSSGHCKSSSPIKQSFCSMT